MVCIPKTDRLMVVNPPERGQTALKNDCVHLLPVDNPAKALFHSNAAINIVETTNNIRVVVHAIRVFNL